MLSRASLGVVHTAVRLCVANQTPIACPTITRATNKLYVCPIIPPISTNSTKAMKGIVKKRPVGAKRHAIKPMIDAMVDQVMTGRNTVDGYTPSNPPTKRSAAKLNEYADTPATPKATIFFICGLLISFCRCRVESKKRQNAAYVKRYWETIADNLSKAGWSWGYVSAVDCNGRTIWIADAHRDGKRYVVRADEKLNAFLELELAVSGRSSPSPS
jgi:hypothetical protein